MTSAIPLYFEARRERFIPFAAKAGEWARRVLTRGWWIRGHERVFLNLVKGMKQAGLPLNVNDHGAFGKSPSKLLAIIGKRRLLRRIPRQQPILLGPALWLPDDTSDVFTQWNVRKLVVPCRWLQDMIEHAWPRRTVVWAAGIDTDLWQPQRHGRERRHAIVYDKLYGMPPADRASYVEKVSRLLRERGIPVVNITYRKYSERCYRKALQRARLLVMLSEHETQGLALMEALSMDVPVVAYDPRVYASYAGQQWLSSAIPYWEPACGTTFSSLDALPAALDALIGAEHLFSPRDYVQAQFSLRAAAERYADIYYSQCKG